MTPSKAHQSKPPAAHRSAPTPLVRDAVAFACVLLVFWATAGGLFRVVPLVQCAIIPGIVAGLVASRWGNAAVVAGVALVAAWLVAPPVIDWVALPRTDIVSLVLVALGCAVTAAAVRFAVSLGDRRIASGAVGVVLLLLIANLWVTSAIFPVPTLQGYMPSTTWLQVTSPTPGTAWSDDEGWLEIYTRMRHGQSFYAAEKGAFTDNTNWGPPASVLGVHPPALYWIWSIIAPSPPGILYGVLTLSSLSIVAVTVLAAQVVRWPVALVGAAITTAHMLFFTDTTSLVMADAWAAPLATLAIAALVWAALRRRWVAPFATGAVLACVTAAVREFGLVLPLAGLVSSALTAKERIRAQVLAWLGVFAVLAVYYGAHFSASRGLVDPSRGSVYSVQPGAGLLALLLRYGSGPFEVNPLVPYLFAFVGLLGVVVGFRGQLRVFFITAVGVSLAVLSVLGPSTGGQGGAYDHWGTVMLAIIYACVPLAFAVIPGMRRAVSVASG